MPINIRSGGQTGVDRAAIDAAVSCGLSYGGWCPRGGWAEDFPESPGLLAKYPALTETPSRRPEQRTAWNVRDSHATLLIVRDNELDRSAGTKLTKRFAELEFLRPWLLVNLKSGDTSERAPAWIAEVAAAVGSRDLWLNVAGPRESNAPGIYADAKAFLISLLSSGSLRRGGTADH
jgi:hypothetical protein